MPGMNAVGRKTAARISAIAITGPETSDIAFSVASRGERPCSMWCSTASTTTIASSTTMPIARTSARSEMVLIEKPNNGKKANVPISETGTAKQRDQRGAEALQEEEHDEDDEGDRLAERHEDLADALRDGERRIERDVVLEIAREALRQLFHQRERGVARVERVRARRLVERDDRGRVAVEPPADVVDLRAQLDARDVAHADHPSRRAKRARRCRRTAPRRRAGPARGRCR